ncbi:MAG: hypothetical protein A2161_17305 [Candidatus Schekmanbacteria bacterium RBG_13_48_7]|uniref:Thioredoxin domain-containing protein n=1 Tax=Candidatus Schekmanbacteria bacterium RBG_13_48_7 TaxID=1817878 RepID=A0A1F7RND9_9BACT|nr:MAG: hypothetical protein A2161_17305 [Candidatus Schekmanbacteria bacterium RBG_13_48_7]
MKNRYICCFLSIVIVFFVFCPVLNAGTKLADFSLKDINQKNVRLKDYIGKKVILIDFWATWCKPCIREMVHLEKIYQEFQERDFVIFCISVDNQTTIARVKPFVVANKYSFPVLLDTNSTVLNLYNPTKTLPYSILIDKEGKIVNTHKGYSDGDEKILLEEIKTLISDNDPKAVLNEESSKKE